MSISPCGRVARLRGVSLIPVLLSVAAFVLLISKPASAQTPAVVQAAETITATALGRHISVLADDSMQGRDTPSPGLELAAQYVAAEFAAAGLAFYGRDNESIWIHRYPISPRLDFERARLVFSGSDMEAVADFRAAAYLDNRRPYIPRSRVSTEVILVAGVVVSRESLKPATNQGKIVLYVPANSRSVDPEVLKWLRAGNRGLVVLSPEDSSTFARQLHDGQRQPRLGFDDKSWVAYVRPEAVNNLSQLFAKLELDVANLRTDTTLVIHDLPALTISFDPEIDKALPNDLTAPNVVGKIQGSDSRLKLGPLLILGHLDGQGIRPGRPDTIVNGANDNASGVAGLLALARAFNQPGIRPRRTVIFAAVSGGLKGFWGSAKRADHLDGGQILGFPLPKAIAALNLDMIGRHTGDSLTVTGLQEVRLPTPLPWIMAAHPELKLTLADGGTLLRPTSDHYPFVRALIPSLSFKNGYHEDGRSLDDAPSRVDSEYAARVARLVFYLGVNLANTNERPELNEVIREQVLNR